MYRGWTSPRVLGRRLGMLRVFGSLIVLGLVPPMAKGEIRVQINHDALDIVISGLCGDPTGDVRIALLDPDTGKNLWTNDGINVPGPDSPTKVNIRVINGIGWVTIQVFHDHTVFLDWDDTVNLTVWIEETQGNANAPLVGWFDVTSAPYAYPVFDGLTLNENPTISGDKTFTDALSFDSVLQLIAGSRMGDIFFNLAPETRLDGGSHSVASRSNDRTTTGCLDWH